MHEHEIRNTQFEDGARVALNSETGRLSIVDADGDASEIKLDDVAAMRLAEVLTTWVAETIGETNAKAIAGAEESLAKLEAMKAAKR